ncbi:MAG: hypothetical protein ACFNZW_06835 [Coriobacteriaceae bacterium]
MKQTDRRCKRRTAMKNRDAETARKEGVDTSCARPENEDDDGYDPWSDRKPPQEPLFEPDPWD